MDQSISAGLVEAYGTAMSALARIEARLALSPHGDALRVRLRMVEAQALSTIEHRFSAWPGGWTDKLSAAYHRLAPPASCRAADVLEWLHRRGATEAIPAGGWPPFRVDLAALAAWQDAVSSADPLPRLLNAADLAGHWGRLAPLEYGNAAVGLVLAGHHAADTAKTSLGGLVAIGLERMQLDWGKVVTAGPDCWRKVWCRAIDEAAARVTELDRRLGAYLAHAEAADRASSLRTRMRDLAELALRRPSTTLVLASSRLGISRPATHRLIEAALAARVLHEVGSKARTRQFIAAF